MILAEDTGQVDRTNGALRSLSPIPAITRLSKSRSGVFLGEAPERSERQGCFTGIRKMFRVESDDSEDLHNKYQDTEKLMEEKLSRLEQELNMKIGEESSSSQRGSTILDSHMSTCLLFLSILVLLLLLVFLTFKLSSRVELLESVCEDIGSFIEQYRSNLTDPAYISERSNPGILKGRRKGRRKSRLESAGPG